MSGHPLDGATQAAGARFDDVVGVSMAVDYGDAAGEYAAARSGAGLYDARDRGVIEIRGGDRAAWLNNLATNAVKNLRTGDGAYSFAINVKGRILFDLNVLALMDAFWLDIDRRLIDKALAHFDRYTITEDVQWRDRSGEYVRIALSGPTALRIVEALGAPHAKAMPALGSTPVYLATRAAGAGAPDSLLVRHDFAGVFGVELYVEAEQAVACWNRLLEIGRPVGLRPVGWSAINTLRIEAGIPWYGRDIDEEVVPAETGQAGRAVSHVKGCYLGQEIVERMRSRGVVANNLVALRFAGAGVGPRTVLKAGEAELGRVTSVCHSPMLGAWIGLGYVRSSHAIPGTQLKTAGDPPIEAEVIRPLSAD